MGDGYGEEQLRHSDRDAYLQIHCDHSGTVSCIKSFTVRAWGDRIRARFCGRSSEGLAMSRLPVARSGGRFQRSEVLRNDLSRLFRGGFFHTFYRYLGLQYPETLAEAQRGEAIPMKRTVLPRTDYLEDDEIETLFKTLPRRGCRSLRDRGIFMVLYNTGARVQEIAGGRNSASRARWNSRIRRCSVCPRTLWGTEGY
jgi:integrase